MGSPVRRVDSKEWQRKGTNGLWQRIDSNGICHLFFPFSYFRNDSPIYQKESLLKLHGHLRSTIHLAQLFQDE